jgi:hypothetical protein
VTFTYALLGSCDLLCLLFVFVGHDFAYSESNPSAFELVWSYVVVGIRKLGDANLLPALALRRSRTSKRLIHRAPDAPFLNTDLTMMIN